MVCVESKKPLTKEIPKGPLQLRSGLQFLESLGFVRLKLHLHEVKRREAEAGHYDISLVEAAALEVKAAEAGKVTINNIANRLNMKHVKASTWVSGIHKLQFDSQTNRIMSGYPGLHVNKPIRVKKGELFKLV